MSDLERYISDNALHVRILYCSYSLRCLTPNILVFIMQFFGISDKTITDYVLASGMNYLIPITQFHLRISFPASSSKTPQALFSSLHAYGLPDNSESQNFVNEVFKRAPRKSKSKSTSDNTRKQAEKEAKALQSQRFSLLLDDDATNNDASSVILGKEAGKKDRSGGEKKHRSSRKRVTDGRDWESDEEEQVRKRRKSSDESPRPPQDAPQDEAEVEAESLEDLGARKEQERMKDLKERDAFAERMKQRDKDRTKKVVEDRTSKGAAAEAAQRRQLANDATARVAALPSLRERSRQDYLTKRELQQIELLRREIADDEALFRGMKVTKQEQRDLEYKKEVLKLAEERMKIDDRYDGYHLPEDYITEQGKIDKKRKEAVLYQRYEEAKVKEDQFVTDVDQWEASQTKNSTFKAGALDKEEVVDDYEYVFDDSQTIKFVMETTMDSEGHLLSAKDRLLNAQIEEARKRGELIYCCGYKILFTSDYSTKYRRD